MRITIDVAPEQELEVLAQLRQLGFSPYSEGEYAAIEESHIQEILRRRADPAMQETFSLEEIKAEYARRNNSGLAKRSRIATSQLTCQ